jgi:hypothetical protein
MFKFLLILLLSPLFLYSQVTKNGIHNYVSNNGNIFSTEFENFYDIKINREIEFESGDILEYSNNPNELGKSDSFLNFVIISDDSSKYSGYYKTKKSHTGIFVKSVILHEICHFYIRNIIDSLPSVKKEYKYATFGAIFIEEGICEYSVINMEELEPNYYFPKNLEDTINVKYRYGPYFVKSILDKYGFKNGVIILLKNEPPTEKEILNPDFFYKRIKIF